MGQTIQSVHKNTVFWCLGVSVLVFRCFKLRVNDIVEGQKVIKERAKNGQNWTWGKTHKTVGGDSPLLPHGKCARQRSQLRTHALTHGTTATHPGENWWHGLPNSTRRPQEREKERKWGTRQKQKREFFGGMRFFGVTKCFFRDAKKKCSWHFRRSKGPHQLFNCSWGRRPKKQPQKQQKQQKAQITRKSAQTTGTAQAAASCTKQHQHRKKAPKGSAKQQAAQTWKTVAQTTAEAAHQERGTQSAVKAAQAAAKAAQSTNSNENNNSSNRDRRGPEGGAPKASLCSHWRLLVEFRFFQAIFEIPVNFLIGYLRAMES